MQNAVNDHNSFFRKQLKYKLRSKLVNKLALAYAFYKVLYAFPLYLARFWNRRFALLLTCSCQKALLDGKANHTRRLTRLDTQ